MVILQYVLTSYAQILTYILHQYIEVLKSKFGIHYLKWKFMYAIQDTFEE